MRGRKPVPVSCISCHSEFSSIRKYYFHGHNAQRYLDLRPRSLRRPLLITKDQLLEYAWGIIANAGDGDWKKEGKEWRKAAINWRNAYFKLKRPSLLE